MIFSTGLIFQRLECVQPSKDVLKEAKLTLERLAHDKDQVVAFLESERNKVNTWTQEKSSTFEEK